MIDKVGAASFGFGRFWYEFIVGDDPLLAAGVAVTLTALALLLRAGVNAWWLTPIVVVALIGGSLRRASQR